VPQRYSKSCPHLENWTYFHFLRLISMRLPAGGALTRKAAS